eukprot:5034845-Pyramimonas_sp.AAC.1
MSELGLLREFEPKSIRTLIFPRNDDAFLDVARAADGIRAVRHSNWSKIIRSAPCKDLHVRNRSATRAGTKQPI